MAINNLNLQQQAAVRYIDSPLLVLAGAGSGKTSVITNKIIYLAQQCHIKISHIYAVTFTNKAAREMQSRVSNILNAHYKRKPQISTFHTLGLKIIRQECEQLGYHLGFSVIDSHDAKLILTDLLEHEQQNENDITPEVLQNQISQWKNQLLLPNELFKQVTDAKLLFMVKVYHSYIQALCAYNVVDFDDLILLPLQLFKTHPLILKKWQNKIHYLLVDEYQDTNAAQYELVKLLIGVSAKLTVVGDDDQSIYAWRGAVVENINRLQIDYPGLKIIKLEQNYRSTLRILRVANHLISHNPHLINKKLWSEHGLGDMLRVIRCTDEEAECERVALEILTHKIRENASYNDYAVLYRSNFQARLLEVKLQKHNIPYQLSGGLSFFSRTEIKDVMGYLRLWMNPLDDNAFLRVINTPKRDIGTVTLTKLGDCAKKLKVSFMECCQHAALYEYLPTRFADRLKMFALWNENFGRKIALNENPITLIDECFEEIGYYDWLMETSGTAATATKRKTNVDFLLASIKKMLTPDFKESDEALSLEDAVGRLVLYDILDQQEENNNPNHVRLSTLHTAKGLEFPHVYIMGFEELLLPHKNSLEGQALEEERRLAYVGITRARKTLTFTLAAKRKQGGEWLSTEPSRFLSELLKEDIEYSGFEQTNPDQKKRHAKLALEAIYKSLSN